MPISKAVQAVFYLKYSFEEMIFFSHHQSNRMDAAPNIHISCQKHGFFNGWLLNYYTSTLNVIKILWKRIISALSYFVNPEFI